MTTASTAHAGVIQTPENISGTNNANPAHANASCIRFQFRSSFFVREATGSWISAKHATPSTSHAAILSSAPYRNAHGSDRQKNAINAPQCRRISTSVIFAFRNSIPMVGRDANRM